MFGVERGTDYVVHLANRCVFNGRTLIPYQEILISYQEILISY